MSNFHDLNLELSDAQQALEVSIHASKSAQDALERAEIALIQATSAHRKAKLDEKLYTHRVSVAKERSYNLRKEASI